MRDDDFRRMSEIERAIVESQQKRRRTLLASSIALTVALTGAIAAFVQLRVERSHKDQSLYVMDSIERIRDQEQQMEVLKKEITALAVESANLQEAIADATAKNSAGVSNQGLTIADRQALDQAKQSATDLNQRVSALENALLQTPDKALAVPLLRQQLLDVADKDKGDSENIHGEINRLYGMMQWFLGLMITLIIGVGGLIVNNFRQNADKLKQSDRLEKQSSPAQS